MRKNCSSVRKKIEKNWQKLTKIDKNSQNFIKIWPKIVLFRNIALIFSLEKPCYLENCVVREPCKRRSAVTGSNMLLYKPNAVLGIRSWSHFFYQCWILKRVRIGGVNIIKIYNKNISNIEHLFLANWKDMKWFTTCQNDILSSIQFNKNNIWERPSLR